MDSQAKLIPLAQKMLQQIKTNKSYQITLSYLSTAISSMKDNSEILLSKVYINLLQENYEVSSLIASLKAAKDINQEIVTCLEKIVYLIQLDSYPNIYGLFNCPEFKTDLVIALKASFKEIYIMRQAIYLSKFYSKIKTKTLEQHVGKELMGDFINRFNWEKKDTYVITAPVKEPFNVHRLMKDLEFIGKMNIAFERITQSNALLTPDK